MKMVERVARATERARKPQWTDAEFETWWNEDPFFCEQITSWAYFIGTRKQRCILEATIALKAMREPSDEMERAWKATDPACYDWGSFHDAHRAGIDAAISEATQKEEER